MADSPDQESVQPEQQRNDRDRPDAALQARLQRIRGQLADIQPDKKLNILHEVMDDTSAISDSPSEKVAIEAEIEVIEALQEVVQLKNEVMKAMQKAALKAIKAETKAILCGNDSIASEILEITSGARDQVASDILKKMS